MTTDDSTPDGDSVLTLQELIRARIDAEGWSYTDLARHGDDVISRNRWQQLGSGTRIKEFPEPETLLAMGKALGVDDTTIVLAAAQSLGRFEIRRRGSDFAQLLPAGVDRLTPRLRDPLLAIIRAVVAETLTDEEDDTPDAVTGQPDHLSWPRVSRAVGRKVRPMGESGVTS